MKNKKDKSAKLFEGYATCGGYEFNFDELDHEYAFKIEAEDDNFVFGKIVPSKHGELHKRLAEWCKARDEKIKCYDVAKELYDKEMARREELYEGYQLGLFPYIKKELGIDEIDKINSFVALCSSESLTKCFKRAVDNYKFYKFNKCYFDELGVPISLVDEAFENVILKMGDKHKGVSEEEFATYINNVISEEFSKFPEVDRAIEEYETSKIAESGGSYRIEHKRY